jgi:hypothetical protein
VSRVSRDVFTHKCTIKPDPFATSIWGIHLLSGYTLKSKGANLSLVPENGGGKVFHVRHAIFSVFQSKYAIKALPRNT